MILKMLNRRDKALITGVLMLLCILQDATINAAETDCLILAFPQLVGQDDGDS